MTRYVMVIDQRRCIGCHSCTVACRTWNKLPLDIVYNPVVTEGAQGTWPNVHKSWQPLLCMHCENPACVEICPQGALYKREEDGLVVQDKSKCIGCKTCISACPYGAPSYDEATSTTFKCDGCYDRRQRGELPACVVACPGANLALDDMESLQSTYTADIVSDENSGTKPNFVITVDAALAEEPDDTVVENRTA